VTLLGATGSIGGSTAALLRERPDLYRVEAVVGHKRPEALAALARELGAALAVVAEPAAYGALRAALAGSGIEAAAGAAAVVEAAARPSEWVMAGIAGTAGLAPTLAAVRRGAMVSLATKECVVCAGGLLLAEAARAGAVILPADSEHNAIFQCLEGRAPATVERLILTASGGPFRTATRAEMARATPAAALRHPTWSMGAGVTIDSATMMNKALEIIEAHHLFAMPEPRIEVLVHSQSIVHSLVAFVDGTCLAQLGAPDMRIPIAYTLAWPGRVAAATPRLDLAALGRLTFEAPDPERFPALALARRALQRGGLAPTMMNAANEVARAAFLDGRIGFLEIVAVVAAVVEAAPREAAADLDTILAADTEARRQAAALVTASRAAP
jgi:1-deoxy-D-xylulose-5-phosphate reductoisomerase